VNCYFCSVCVLLRLVIDLQQKQNIFSQAQTIYEFILCPLWSFNFFYIRIGIMVAILPTHPRVSKVTCMRADAKQQRGLTRVFSHTHTNRFSWCEFRYENFGKKYTCIGLASWKHLFACQSPTSCKTLVRRR
jgi:hypothetical protein